MEYGMIDANIWLDDAFNPLDAESKVLYLYLCGNAHMNWIGLYKLPSSYASFDTHISLDHIEKAFGKLQNAGLVKRDGIWVFVPAFLSLHLPKTECQLKGSATVFRDLGPSPFDDDLVECVSRVWSELSFVKTPMREYFQKPSRNKTKTVANDTRMSQECNSSLTRVSPEYHPSNYNYNNNDNNNSNDNTDSFEASSKPASGEGKNSPFRQLFPAQSSVESPKESDDSPVVAEFPCVGTGDKTFRATEKWLDSLRDAFPGVDLDLQCKQARAWVIANPDRRKTARGMQKFLTAWFSREQNRVGGNGGGQGQRKGWVAPDLTPDYQADLNTSTKNLIKA